MSTEQKPLTAEEILDITPGVRFDGPYGPFVRAMERYAAQHTAALQEENGRLRLQRLKDADDMLTVMQQHNDAVKLLDSANTIIQSLCDFLNQQERAAWMGIRQGLERLSSGETTFTPSPGLEAVKPPKDATTKE